jgi:hypothetical protein
VYVDRQQFHSVKSRVCVRVRIIFHIYALQDISGYGFTAGTKNASTKYELNNIKLQTLFLYYEMQSNVSIYFET